jgi:hypothetical protein
LLDDERFLVAEEKDQVESKGAVSLEGSGAGGGCANLRTTIEQTLP